MTLPIAIALGNALPGSLKSNANILVMAATILLVGVVGLLTWMQFTNGRQAQFLVRHTNEVITAVDELRIAVRSAETSQRGYLLTGREDYLARTTMPSGAPSSCRASWFR